MTWTPLQSTSCYTSNPWNLLGECVLPQVVAAVGSEQMFGLLLGGSLIAGLWLAGDGDLATPAAVTVLVGGVLFPILPGGYLGIARTVAFLGLVAVILAVLEKYYLEGAQ
jgi:hypothetical protein